MHIKKILTLALIVSMMNTMSYANTKTINPKMQELPESTIGSENPFEMDGRIGNWNPNVLDGLEDKFLDLESSQDLEGTIPQSGEYYTISVTVPLEMDFMVITQHTQHGKFYSPKYKVINHGRSEIRVSVEKLQRKSDNQSLKEGSIPLYVEPIVSNDDRIQIELKIKELLDPKNNGIYVDGKIVDLYNLNSSSSLEEKTLFDGVPGNEERVFSFDSTHWELPSIVLDENGNPNTDASSVFETFLKLDVKI